MLVKEILEVNGISCDEWFSAKSDLNSISVNISVDVAFIYFQNR